MKKSKFSESQIVAVLKQGDAGVPIKNLRRQTGISASAHSHALGIRRRRRADQTAAYKTLRGWLATRLAAPFGGPDRPKNWNPDSNLMVDRRL